ncbi:DUF2000 domain-containing protein [Candidatus Saccharibacteria bacterium]|nr:DUF2000 domain-containing protein [Candidatus Saccharibacteria bacterium]
MKVSNDFKMVIVLDDDLSLGLKTNTAAVLSLTLGSKVEGLIGHDLHDKAGNKHTSLTRIPVPILRCSPEQLKQTYDQAYELDGELLLVDITDAAQTTTNYQDYQQKLELTEPKDLKLLGIALAGSKSLVNKLTGNMGLVR